MAGKGFHFNPFIHVLKKAIDTDAQGNFELLSLELIRRLRLIPASAAFKASSRWTSGGTLTTNFPL
jgi:hypothetical protein